MIPLWSFAVFAKWLTVLVLGYLACWALVEVVNTTAEWRARRRRG